MVKLSLGECTVLRRVLREQINEIKKDIKYWKNKGVKFESDFTKLKMLRKTYRKIKNEVGL